MHKHATTNSPADKNYVAGDNFRLFPEVSRQVESLLSGKHKSLDWSFTLPVSVPERCVWCDTPAAPVTLHDGRTYYAQLFSGEEGVIRVDFTRPHFCREIDLYEEFREPAEESGNRW